MDADEARDRARQLGFSGNGTSVGQLSDMRAAVMGDSGPWSTGPTGEELPEDWPAIFYALVQDTRRMADFYERWLIRSLRDGDTPSGEALTWAAVAEAVDSHLGSRQAAQAKWKRLLSDNRRDYGGPGRGGRRPK